MEVQESTNISLEIDHIFKLQQVQALRNRSTSAVNRIAILQKLLNWITSNSDTIRKAIHADFRKPYPEIDISEIFVVTSEIKHTIKNLENWMKPKRVPTPMTMLGSKSYIHYEPKGTSLIIAPWNYPFNLAIGPLVSALAAGCTAIIKPSEMTPACSKLISDMVAEVFDKNHVAVIEGEIEVSQLLLAKPFDHIFFTGSPSVGKIIMKAAAENLSSVTLELGGKSPALVDSQADLKDAAAKIIWGKFVNCGQTCIAPDYVLVHHSLKDQLLEELDTQLKKMYNPSDKGIDKSKDYARIVNSKHFRKLEALHEDAKQKGAKTYCGGLANEEELFFEPTILTDLSESMDIMQEEIFGPILPVISFVELEEAITYINLKPKPLALYVFTNDDYTIKRVFRETSSGGAVANDCVLHFLQVELPFGGVNNSGIGKAHGYYGFLAFSNQKAVLKQRVGMTAIKPMYPPYGLASRKIIQALLKWF